MYVIFPSDSDTGTLSTIATDFESARYYTIAIIIEGTLADTKIKQGFPSPPQEGTWGAALRRLGVEVAVANSIKPETVSSIRASGIRVISGAKALVGDLIDWIADIGLDEFEEKIEMLNKPAPAKEPPKKSPPPPQQKVEPVVTKPSGNADKATAEQKKD